MSVARCCCPRGPKPPTVYLPTMGIRRYRNSLVFGQGQSDIDYSAGVGGGNAINWASNDYGYDGLSILITDNQSNLPQGSVISRAYFTGAENITNQNWRFSQFANGTPIITWIMDLYAEETASPLTHQFPPAAGGPGLTATVQWNESSFPPGITDPGGVDSRLVESPNVTSLVQQIVNDAGWTAGSTMHFFWWPNASMVPPPVSVSVNYDSTLFCGGTAQSIPQLVIELP